MKPVQTDTWIDQWKIPRTLKMNRGFSDVRNHKSNRCQRYSECSNGTTGTSMVSLNLQCPSQENDIWRKVQTLNLNPCEKDSNSKNYKLYTF